MQALTFRKYHTPSGTKIWTLSMSLSIVIFTISLPKYLYITKCNAHQNNHHFVISQKTRYHSNISNFLFPILLTHSNISNFVLPLQICEHKQKLVGTSQIWRNCLTLQSSASCLCKSHTHTDTHRHTDTHAHRHRHTDIDTQTQTHRHTDTQTHTHPHTHTHTHTPTHTHTHKQ